MRNVELTDFCCEKCRGGNLLVRRDQSRSQALRFGVKNTFMGEIFFVFIIWLKQMLLDTTKLGAQKIGEELLLNAPQWLRTWERCVVEEIVCG